MVYKIRRVLLLILFIERNRANTQRKRERAIASRERIAPFVRKNYFSAKRSIQREIQLRALTIGRVYPRYESILRDGNNIRLLTRRRARRE